MKSIIVFVYGTLRAGQSNHSIIAPHILRPIGEGQIQGRMYHWGGFPAVTLEKPGIVYGEWYEIKASGLPALDRLEGYPTLYNRSVVSDVSGQVQGIVYHMPDAKASRHARGIVRSGDWVMRETVGV
ncbi:MAG: gamma-glutamylcyclotransferase [Firmicutes bacterium]|nr:gamma-glutamylcyclotransferase [Bacillota bacterium]